MSKRKVKISESELKEHFSQLLFEESCGCDEKIALTEDLTTTDKSDVKTLVRNEIKSFLKLTQSESLDTMVKGMVKEYITKDKSTEKYLAEISKRVLIEFYKTLWTRSSIINTITI